MTNVQIYICNDKYVSIEMEIIFKYILIYHKCFSSHSPVHNVSKTIEVIMKLHMKTYLKG